MATRTGIIDTRAFIPESNEEANGEIMGRGNALHDWLMKEAEGKYFSSDNQMACTLMGFHDVIRYHAECLEEIEAKEKAEKEKASAANTD